jgi:DNA polymerase-1
MRGALKTNGMIKGYTDVYDDGRLHPYFNQIVDTGRMSCKNPNVQQIPRDFKDKFYKEQEGKKIIKIDYPAIELRILASFLYENFNDRTMIENFKRDLDPHKATASLLFKVDYDEVTKEQRQSAKAVNFGLSYGMGALRFANYAKGYGLNLTIEEAEQLKKKFKNAYPSLMTWHNEAGDATREKELVIVRTLAGRTLTAKTFSETLNFPIQGTGGDITKYAINIFYDLLKEYDLLEQVSIISIVHDEIIVEATEHYAEVAEKFLKQAMEVSADYILKYFKTEV